MDSLSFSSTTISRNSNNKRSLMARQDRGMMGDGD